MSFVAEHGDLILDVVIALLVLSEALPFVKRWKGNGLLHALVELLRKSKAPAALLVVVMSASACAGWQNNLRQSVAAAAELGTTTTNMVAALDEAKLQEVANVLWQTKDVRLAEAERDAWLSKYHKASQALHVYAAAVSAAKLASEMAIAGKQQDIGRILRDLLVAARALKDALASFGIEMPLGGLL
jgi:hypothetical protein